MTTCAHRAAVASTGSPRPTAVRMMRVGRSPGVIRGFPVTPASDPRARTYSSHQQAATAPTATFQRRVNAQEHGRASQIQVRISVGRRRTLATVEDDGRGFEVENTLQRAARRGRLDLAGLAERVRMLGGTVRIESSPGGPTRLSAVLPHWESRADKRVRAA